VLAFLPPIKDNERDYKNRPACFRLMFHWLQPNLILDSVQDITPELLQRYELRSLLLDVDSTLKRYRATEIPPEIVQWIKSLQETGIGCCVLSNGRVHRIRPLAEQMDIPLIAPAMKPFPFGCWTAIKTRGFDPKSTAMVGDQVFADILAGKFAKIFTILVTPIHPEEERLYTRMKRPLEKWVLRKTAE
jgi:HAD superfamily phosphatase (TIGR01668 family)